MPFKTRFTNGGLGVSFPLRKSKLTRAQLPPTAVYIGVDSNKLPIKTLRNNNAANTTAAANFASEQSGSRYPNYLPLLKARRVETSKQGFYKLHIQERLEKQRLAEETALSNLLLKPQWKLPFPEIPPMGLRHHESRLLNYRPNIPKKGTPKEIESLYRAPPTAFSDSGSPILQIELANSHRHRPTTASLPNRLNSRNVAMAATITDSTVSNYLNKMRHHRHHF